MLDIKIGQGIGCHLHASGKTGELLNELGLISNLLYRQIVGDDEAMANDIKMLIRMAVLDDSSPYWRDIDLGDGATAIRIEDPRK
jgi:hypothetical protein